MICRVEVSRKVEKYLSGLRTADLQRRLIAAMRGLENNPRPPGSVKLSGSDDLFRMRVGDYRIIYQIQDRVLVVLVVDIGLECSPKDESMCYESWRRVSAA